MEEHFLREELYYLGSDRLLKAGLLPFAILVLLSIRDFPLRKELLQLALWLRLIISVLVFFVSVSISIQVFDFFIYWWRKFLDLIHHIENAVGAVLDKQRSN